MFHVEHILKTERLVVRQATIADTDHYFELWTNPKVMKFVGFPHGLKITKDEIEKLLEQTEGEVLNCRLLVSSTDGEKIGECKLGKPDDEGISETDVKLLPQYWGRGYGKEIKRALVDWLFTNTECIGVKATPNKLNIASQKMQESVGARLVGEQSHQFPDSMRDYTEDVHSLVYIVYKEDWEAKKGQSG